MTTMTMTTMTMTTMTMTMTMIMTMTMTMMALRIVSHVLFLGTRAVSYHSPCNKHGLPPTMMARITSV